MNEKRHFSITLESYDPQFPTDFLRHQRTTLLTKAVSKKACRAITDPTNYIFFHDGSPSWAISNLSIRIYLRGEPVIRMYSSGIVTVNLQGVFDKLTQRKIWDIQRDMKQAVSDVNKIGMRKVGHYGK